MRITRTSVLLMALLPAVAGYAVEGDAASGTIRVVIGYPSKTINTVTAGTLLRSHGHFEKQLAALGAPKRPVSGAHAGSATGQEGI